MTATNDNEGSRSVDGERRIVLHPRTASARRLDRSRVDGGHVRGFTTNTDEVLEYMRAQRRLALATFLPVLACVVAVLLTTIMWEGFGTMQIGRVNVLWLVLGPVTLFSILAATVAHERRALRLEQAWMDKRQ